MKRLEKLGITLLLLVGLTVGLYPNGLNLNGNGSKAIGMGGAFVGLADDYSALYWNPAGLIQTKNTTITLFASDVIPSGTYKLDAYGIDAETETKHYITPGFAFVRPLSDKVVIGFYAHVPSGLGAKWKGDQLKLLTSGKTYKWESLVGLVSFSPGIAVKLSDIFSLGATVNINYGLLKLKRPINALIGQYEEDLRGWAVGATFGALFKPSDKFSMGLSFKLPIQTTMSGTAKIPGASILGLPGEDDAERAAEWPLWAGAGIAFKPTDRLTLTADVHYTNWKTMTVIEMDFYNPGWKLYFEEGANFEMKWKDTLQLRLGMEYKASETLALRAGYYHDPNPSPKKTQNILLPEITYNFFNVGFGYKSKHLTIDASCEFGIGKDKVIDFTEVDPNAGMPGTHGMNMVVPNISFTYNFN